MSTLLSNKYCLLTKRCNKNNLSNIFFSRFENNRLKNIPEEYQLQLEVLRNKTLNNLYDAIEKQRENEKVQMSMEQQREICFQLRSQLQVCFL